MYPEAEHQRLAGVVAAAWGNDEVKRPPLPFESWVRGVAVHDRAYGELDEDLIGAVAPVGYRAGGYPERLDPVERVFRLVPTPD